MKKSEEKRKLVEELTALYEKLDLFHKRIKRLKLNSDFFVSSRVDIKYDKVKGVHNVFKGPDIKTVKAFLLDFRPFILNDEPVNFDFISNMVYQLAPDTITKINIAKAKKTWSSLLERKKGNPVGGLRLQIDGQKLVSQANMDMWLNAEFFHLDYGKRDLIGRISGNPMEQISYFLFIDLLQRLSELLFWFDKNVVEVLLVNNKK